MSEWVLMVVGLATAWLQTIPATAYVGILAFVGTVLTITRNNAAAERRATQQAVDARAMDEARRLYDSRRTVYEGAAEIATQGVSVIAQMADLTRETKEITAPFLNASGALAKVHLFASFETSCLVVKVGREIGSAIVELTVERTAVEWSSRGVAALPFGPEYASTRVDDARLKMDFSEACLARSMAVMPTLGAALGAIRADLQLPPNDYSGMLKAQADDQLVHFRQAMDRLRRQLGIQKS